MADPVWSPPLIITPQPDWRSPLPAYIQIPEWNPGTEAQTSADLGAGTDWDHITIAGKRLAAFVQIDGDRDTRIDVKQTPGPDGATATTLGVSPAPITIRLRFLTAAALQEWANLIPDLQPKPGKPRVDPVDVYHPALAMNGVKSLYLKTLGAPKVSGPGGYVEVVTRWLEFLPPKKASTHTMTGSRTKVDAGSNPSAQSMASHKPSSGNAGP